MLEEMRDFLLDEELARKARDAFGEMFGSADAFDELYDEMHDVALAWRPPRHLRRTTLVFCVLIPIAGQDSRRWPLSDIMKMKIENIARIPGYIRNHPYVDTYEHIPDEGWQFTAPLILTTTDDLLASWAYILDDEEAYRPVMMAAILYEMALLDGSILGSDSRKKSLIDNMRTSMPEECGITIDDLLIEAGRSVKEKNKVPASPRLETLELSRYNAQLEIYERLHFDMAKEFSQEGK
jgi:hypothetical protein